jgi:hypothetical protein
MIDCFIIQTKEKTEKKDEKQTTQKDNERNKDKESDNKKISATNEEEDALNVEFVEEEESVSSPSKKTVISPTQSKSKGRLHINKIRNKKVNEDKR